MSNDLISRSIAIDEFYSRVGGDLSISDVKYIETVLNGVPTACHVDMIIDKMDGIIQKYRKIGTPEECSEAVEAAQRHRNDGWIPCSERLPDEHLCSMCSGSPEDESQLIYYASSELVQVTVYDADTDETYVSDDCLYNGEWSNFCGGRYEVLAWQPLPSPYNQQKSVGEDYKQRIMDRFTRTE